MPRMPGAERAREALGLAPARSRKPRPDERFVVVDPPELVARFIVTGEPTPKARPRVVRNGTATYTPKTTKRAEDHVLQCCWLSNPRLRAVEGHIKLVLRFHLGAAGRGDIDNYTKLAMDSLNAVAWVDDSQVVELDARLVPWSPEPPHSEVEVWLTAKPLSATLPASPNLD